MEATEEPPLQNATAEVVKTNVITCEESAGVEIPEQSNVCHKSNGVADSGLEPAQSVDATEISPEEHPSDALIEEEHNIKTIVTEDEPVSTEVVVEVPIAAEELTKEEPTVEDQNLEDEGLKTDDIEELNTEAVEVDGVVETMPENVRFETEILIETNVDDQSSKYHIIYEDEPEQPDHANNILNDLGHNIELSEVLRSSNIAENVENNNCDVAQEVFNKEELLDILEGNDVDESRKVISDSFAADCKKLETQLALQQLSRLKKNRKSRSTPKKYDKKTPTKSESLIEDYLTPRKRRSRQREDNSQINSGTTPDLAEESVKKKSSKQKDNNSQGNTEGTSEHKEETGKKRGDKQKDDNTQSNVEEVPEHKGETAKKRANKQNDDNSQSNIEGPTEIKDESAKKRGSKQKDENVPTGSDAIVQPKQQNIVNALVQDWEDDEPSEGDQAKNLIAESDKLLLESEEIVKSQDAVVNETKVSNADAPMEDGQTPNLNKSDSETQPQRRLSRVIKKKVIFDPDNPDTFTKTKVAVKKDNQPEKDPKESHAPKKVKTEITPRSKSKSPIQSKLQWKKPQPKNIKQNKRLTEIDRLLMDEGAVNMICQLTPEAPQGNKNMKSKAEFIKKIQSSTTPEGKEMKFRERKKEFKGEEGDVKMLKTGKERLSLSSSVKSPTVSEDFEAHSADDSIIYRRHSSSSYSSPCMSPRRMSDVEGANQSAAAVSQQSAREVAPTQQEDSTTVPAGTDVFMADLAATPTTAVINKSNLMSIKEKLNSKLSLALNKRKSDSPKAEKPPKKKRVSKSSEKAPVFSDFKYVRLTTDQRLAEVCIQKIGTIFNVEIMNELRAVLDTVESKNDISVTLLTSESGALCSGLELNSILDQEHGTKHALELAESARLLLCTLESHSKLVCGAVGDRCHGLALSLVALSDIVVASETATFQLSSFKGAPLQPGAAALTARGLPQSLLNELIVFERCVSAGEALQGGLVTRTVWPDRVHEQARAIARDIAAQPHENIMLKKQLLKMKRGVSESFLAGVQAERDLFVNYWRSTEGRQLVRASLNTAKE